MKNIQKKMDVYTEKEREKEVYYIALMRQFQQCDGDYILV